MAGARWVQKELLARDPSANLSVYTIWLPMLWSDARQMWNGNTMPDSRVIHYWDGERQIGRWFSEKVEGYDGIAWDVYYLYGPDAAWQDIPSPLISSGSSIYRERATLESSLRALLGK